MSLSRKAGCQSGHTLFELLVVLAILASRATTATFETNGRFALTTTNALGHAESAATDPKFGVTTSQTGPNNLTSSWTYDSFGRPTLETRPDGNRTAFAYEYCSGVNGGTASCPTHGAYVVTATPQNASGLQNGPWVRTFYDTHGRARRRTPNIASTP